MQKVITRDAELVERYLKALEQEMTAVAKGLGQRTTLSQLHLGGGTPDLPQLGSVDQADRDAEASLRNRPGGGVGFGGQSQGDDG